MLGIIGAMDEEVAKLKETMQDVTVETKASMEFYKGTMNGKEVVVVRSGIGKVNAGICTQILCDLYHVDAVINTGIAGSLNAKIDIGDIVLSTDALQHDMDATGFGYEPGVIPRMETSTFIADEKLRKLAKECCERVNPDIHVFEGRVVSGDQFISDKAKKVLDNSDYYVWPLTDNKEDYTWGKPYADVFLVHDDLRWCVLNGEEIIEKLKQALPR